MNDPIIVGDATLYHGDCLEILPTLPNASAWLIERGQATGHVPTIWWCGGAERVPDESTSWTQDASKAVKFPSFYDADRSATKIFGVTGLFHITNHVFLGDAKIGALITDPPYGVNLSSKRAKQRDGGVTSLGHGYASFDDSEERVRREVIPRVELALSIVERGALTPGTRCMMFYPLPTDVGCFFSAASTGMSAWGFACSQPIFYYGTCPFQARGLGARANSCGQTYPNDANETGHPCAKPIRMMNWLVGRASWEGETVLDPFMGSGTTGVACANLGRKFIGIEIEKKYFDIACERIDNAYRQARMFS